MLFSVNMLFWVGKKEEKEKKKGKKTNKKYLSFFFFEGLIKASLFVFMKNRWLVSLKKVENEKVLWSSWWIAFPFFYLLICTRKCLQILKNQSNGQISEELDYI